MSQDLAYNMQDILVQLQAMYLFYRSAHVMASGHQFYQDHKLFKHFYEETQDAYDSVAERAVGLGRDEELNLTEITSKAASKCATLPFMPPEDADYFKASIGLERDMRNLCWKFIQEGCSEGTRQLLGDVMNLSEARVYKMKRRIVSNGI